MDINTLTIEEAIGHCLSDEPVTIEWFLINNSILNYEVYRDIDKSFKASLMIVTSAIGAKKILRHEARKAYKNFKEHIEKIGDE